MPDSVISAADGRFFRLEIEGLGTVVYVIPAVVMWRVNRIIKREKKRGTSEEDTLKLLFSPIKEAIRQGRIGKPLPGPTPMLLRPTDEEGGELDLPHRLGFDIEQAHRIHRLCAYWEAELGIPSP